MLYNLLGNKLNNIDEYYIPFYNKHSNTTIMGIMRMSVKKLNEFSESINTTFTTIKEGDVCLDNFNYIASRYIKLCESIENSIA